ncbi:MAG: hypothetical protein RR959_09005 [Erysipelotrichaceae bacterium]
MQKEFIIEDDEELNKFTCDVNGVLRCSPFIRDLLDDIAKLYDYTYKERYSESHYKIMLEEDLGISIKLNFDY